MRRSQTWLVSVEFDDLIYQILHRASTRRAAFAEMAKHYPHLAEAVDAGKAKWWANPYRAVAP